MIDRRVLFIACLLLPMLAPSGASAQNAASPAAGVNSAKAKDSAAVKDSASAKPAAEPAAAKGLDLDELLVADEEGDLLTEDKPAAPKAASDSAVASRTDGQPADAGESAKAADSAGAAPPTPSGGRRGPPAPKTAKADAADAGPAIVEEGRTINFAQNLKEYRSPRLAMLLSLLVPGLGQAYSRSYIKASAFGAAEIAAIWAAFHLNSVAKSKKKDAYNYADAHFSVDSIKRYDEGLREKFYSDTLNMVNDTFPDFQPYENEFYTAAGSKDKGAYYYERIRDRQFTPGWENNELSVEQLLSVSSGSGQTDTIYGKGGSRYTFYEYAGDGLFYFKRIIDYAGNAVSNSEPSLGYSNYQAAYNAMMDESNSSRDLVNYMLYVIILNHIASAVDAGFTARAYNARLLGEDNSAWNRLSVEQSFVFTGSGHSPGVSLRVRF